MFTHRFRQRALCLTVAAFAVGAVFAAAVPGSAAETAAAARAPQARRAATSFTNALRAANGTGVMGNGVPGGFLYFPEAPGGVTIGGRVNVGKSHVYVPYYGSISTDPAHPGVQGATGLAYGFRTWDISLMNGGLGTTQAPLPGIDQPKVNPSLSLSIRF